VCHGFLLGGRIPYLEPKHTFKEFEMVKNKHREESGDGKGGNKGLKAMILSCGS